MAVELGTDMRTRLWVTLLTGALMTFLGVTGWGDVTLKELAMKLIAALSGTYVVGKSWSNVAEAKNGKTNGGTPPE